MSKLIKVVIAAPHFPPSNLTCGHRTRLFAEHLPEFGYEPIVLTVDPAYYEETPDPELSALVPKSLRVIRTRAFPVRPIRIVGDLGIRSFVFQYWRLRQMAERREFSLLYLPIPPNYTALLGPMIKRNYGIPYAIDYIDPWVYPITAQEKSSWKARATHILARLLEPHALSQVDGISGVADGYFADVLKRHPELRGIPTLGVPYGASPADHAYVQESKRPSRLLKMPELENRKVLVYAGAFLPRAVGTFHSLFEATQRLRAKSPELVAPLRYLFVGTGSGGEIGKIAAAFGVSDLVIEVPERQPYLEILATLHAAHGTLIIGSSEPHYTASKVFQALLAERPILAALHEASTAAEWLRKANGVQLVTFPGPVESIVPELEAGLEKMLVAYDHKPVARDAGALAEHDTRAVAEKLAGFFDRILRVNQNENRSDGGSRDPRSSQAVRRY